MSTLSPQDIKEQLAQLSAQFGQQLEERVGRISQQWLSALSGDEWRASVDQARREAHTLAGSAGTFGYQTCSKVARQLEKYLQRLLEQEERPGEAQEEVFDQTFQKLLESIRVGNEPATEPVTQATALQPAGKAQAISIGRNVIEESKRTSLIYVVEDEELLATDLSLQLGQFGYKTRCMHSLKELDAALREEMPDVLLMDIELPDGSGADYILQRQQDSDCRRPVIFMSAHCDLDNRLKAVRAGADDYLEKPVDIGMLVDRVDSLTNKGKQDPYRILLVDDTRSMRDFCATTLRDAGMLVKALSGPEKLLQALDEINPDLILLDLHMPKANGLELARVIRQLEGYVTVPIVYFSTDHNLDRQYNSIGIHGDDFLHKPIAPEHLVVTIRGRAQRARKLRSLMHRDSLTGLFNHTTTKEKLENEINRARRTGSSFVYGMIDIDRFKSINDTYGHPVGDRVIKSLSRLLKQRLRKTDIVGRYGGEEFAVIMLDTDIAQAERVCNEVREAFSTIQHQADGIRFSATFSCGLAAYPSISDGQRLSDSADRALYQAKHNGRNKVVCYSDKD